MAEVCYRIVTLDFLTLHPSLIPPFKLPLSRLLILPPSLPSLPPSGYPPADMSQFMANLMAMQAGMQNGMNQQYDQDGWELPPQEWLQQNHERRVGPPPASARVLRRMPGKEGREGGREASIITKRCS